MTGTMIIGGVVVTVTLLSMDAAKRKRKLVRNIQLKLIENHLDNNIEKIKGMSAVINKYKEIGNESK